MAYMVLQPPDDPICTTAMLHHLWQVQQKHPEELVDPLDVDPLGLLNDGGEPLVATAGQEMGLGAVVPSPHRSKKLRESSSKSLNEEATSHRKAF